MFDNTLTKQEELNDGLSAYSRYNSHLALWRNTIALFCKSDLSSKFASPIQGIFYSAGYSSILIEATLRKKSSTSSNSYYTPDILSVNENSRNAVLIEITRNDDFNRKKEQIQHYLNDIDLTKLNHLGFDGIKSHDVFLSKESLYEEDQKLCCEIVQSDIFDCKNESLLHDKKLLNIIVAHKGERVFTNLSGLKFSILPEMEKSLDELKYGIYPFVMKIFGENFGGKIYLSDIVKLALDGIYNSINPRNIHTLEDKVENILSDLVDRYLSEYLEYKNDERAYVLTAKGLSVKSSPSSLNKVSSIIENWRLGLPPKQKRTKRRCHSKTQHSLLEFIP